MAPLLALLYVGPFVSVPVRPFPLKSVHVVPVPGYDAVLPASRWSARPLVASTGVPVDSVTHTGAVACVTFAYASASVFSVPATYGTLPAESLSDTLRLRETL